MPSRSGTLVMKFGGTSVGTVEAMQQAIQIVRDGAQSWQKLVVIVSAFSGITNLLLDSATRAALGDQESFRIAERQLHQRHTEMINAFLAEPAVRAQVQAEIEHWIAEFSSRCAAIAVLGEATPRALDFIAGLGERMCARVMASALQHGGTPAAAVDATRLIVTDDHFQAAHPNLPATTQRARQVLEPIFAGGQAAIVTGFIGATETGVPTTLGRGGSDYSAALLGAILAADDVWIWTDVDGVMTADPRLVVNARTISEVSYREVSELAYFGAKVLHPKTIRPVIEAGIGLRVCNTFNPGHPGTRLVAELPAPATGIIKAVTAIRGLQLITLEGRGMLGVPGVAARTFGAVAATGTSVPLISQASSEQSICFAVPIEATRSVIAALQHSFASEIASRDIDRVWASDEIVIITVVGAGMRSTPGIAGKIFQALGESNVNVIAIAQGSSEVSISLIVDAADTHRAVNTLHALIETR